MRYNSPRTLYNDIYKNYSQNRDKASNDVTELPTVLELLGDIEGKNILDMGCGLGKHAKEFLSRGANVIGYDASEKMVEHTIEYCKGKGTFFRATHEKVTFSPASFDIVNASLTLAYSSQLSLIFENVSRWLKPGGIFTFSIPHSVWLFERVEKMDYSKPHKIQIRINSYDVNIFNFYYPLDTYIQLINKHDFQLLHMVETTIPKKYKGWREDRYRLPNTVVFKLQKKF